MWMVEIGGIALGALPNAHNLSECHSPYVEERPGHCKEWQCQHGHDSQIKALVLLFHSCRQCWLRHGSRSSQTSSDNSTLRLFHLRSCN